KPPVRKKWSRRDRGSSRQAAHGGAGLELWDRVPSALLLLADRHGGPVGGDLGHDLRDLVAVEAHGQDGVGAALAGRVAQALEGLLAALDEEVGVAARLAAEDGAEAGAHVREQVA